MCEDCPTCPECGQSVAEWPTPEYLAGLLLPPVVAAVVLLAAWSLDAVADWLFWFTSGMFTFGTWMLLRTDEHVQAAVDDLDVELTRAQVSPFPLLWVTVIVVALAIYVVASSGVL